MLCGGLLALAGTTVNAADTSSAPPTTPPTVQTNTQAAENTIQSSAPATKDELLTKTNNTPATTNTAVVLSCNYHFPTGTTAIDQTLVLQWAEKATQQAFEFEYNVIENQLIALKPCFTDQGWKSYDEALKKSGNIDAIKSQQLVVSSMADGQGTVTPVKDNQWKVNLPLQVVYQNGQRKLTQILNVDLLIGRKSNGDLGIMQMIAAPRQTGTAQATTPAPATTE